MRYVLDHEGKMYRKYFEDIASIPHESFNEKQLSDYIVDFAKKRNLWCHQDEVYNVIVKKQASKGYENHDPVIIQGHIDMVCVKTPDSKHDFDKDSLELYVENGFLKAKDTTLGADCGHGISYMLSVLDDDNLQHPPLECLFTVQEEVGIGGPKYIDYSLLEGRRMIATDSMEEGSPEMSTTSVVGGVFQKKVTIDKISQASTYRISVGGLTGGHAAVDINKCRANAIKILVRATYEILKKADIRICSIRGGTLKNNIPDEAELVFCIKDNGKTELYDEILEEIIKKFDCDIKFEYRKSDKNIFINLEKTEHVSPAVDEKDSRDIIKWIMEIPTGTYMTDCEDMTFPWTSRNLGTLELSDGRILAGYMFRSCLKSHIEMMFDELNVLAELFGAEWKEEYSYPGYVVEEGTPMYKAYEEVYREMSGKELKPHHIHAGTDVGTIMENLGGRLDVVGIGPNTYKFHTPDEQLDIASYDRVYGYIVEMLKRL